MSNVSRMTKGLPAGVHDLLSEVGRNIRIARKRRRMTITALAEKLMVSAPTVRKLERGDPTISFGVVVSALWVMGLDDQVGRLAAPADDEQGLQAELLRIEQRSGRKKAVVDDLDF